MEKKKPFYITTTLPYINANPHIGFALEIVQADAIARYQRLLGKEVIFNTGTDEHGLKIYRKAKQEGIDIQTYIDIYAKKFDFLKKALNLSYTNFIRTSNEHHVHAAQEFWRRCDANGFIEKRIYQAKYCVGCELEKTDSELNYLKCSLHPNMEIELINEENYFFLFSKFSEKLLQYYAENLEFVIPNHRFNEIKAFVERGLTDFSISRLKEKMPWGIAVPDDSDHVMYVWFDALVNYISTLGWPEDEKQFETFWGTKDEPNALQVAGKDNLRQQSAMWQAMLLAADLPMSKQVFVHGFIISEGQKMSKSLGNVVDPYVVIDKYGTDAVRFYLLGALPSYDDGDWSTQRFEEFYTAHLANGIGNLTSRILTMVEKYDDGVVGNKTNDTLRTTDFWDKYNEAFTKFDFETVIGLVNNFARSLDEIISEEKPWKKVKNGEDISGLLYQLTEGLRHVAIALLPIIPESAEKILSELGISLDGLETFDKERQWGRLKQGAKVEKGEALFPRLV